MFQTTLFGSLPFHLGDLVATAQRTQLDDDCWVDHASGWVQGPTTSTPLSGTL